MGELIKSFFEEQFLSFAGGIIVASIAFLLKREFEKQKFKFTKLHEIRIDKLSELYSLMIDFAIQDKLLSQPNNSLKDSNRIFSNWVMALREFFYFYHKNRIVFSDEVKKNIGEYIDESVRFKNQIINDSKSEEKVQEVLAPMFPKEENEYLKSELYLTKISDFYKKKINKYEEIRTILETEFKVIATNKI